MISDYEKGRVDKKDQSHFSIIIVLYFLLVVECGEGPVVINASHNIVHGYYGDILLYSCHHGYWFKEEVYEKEVTCSVTGEWLPSLPSGCKGEHVGPRAPREPSED